MTARVHIEPSQRRGSWVVVDDRGRIHSSTPQPKARAQAQADAMNTRQAARVPLVDVHHYDPATGLGEVVRDLDPRTAARLIDHETAAGRVAYVVPKIKRRTYR